MKKAMSMIELVISIVVMGIVVAGIPMILQRTQGSSVLNAVRQENILIAKTQLWRMLSYDWAPNSFNALDQKAYILNTQSANTNLQLNTKLGLTGLSGRRSISPTGAMAGAINGVVNNVANIPTITNINGFHGLDIDIAQGTKIDNDLRDADKLDYTTKDKNGNAIATATANIGYFNDRFNAINFNGNTINITLSPANLNANPRNAASSSNIKVITETVNTGLDIDGDTVNESIVMYGFASNVGQSLEIDPRGIKP